MRFIGSVILFVRQYQTYNCVAARFLGQTMRIIFTIFSTIRIGNNSMVSSAIICTSEFFNDAKILRVIEKLMS